MKHSESSPMVKTKGAVVHPMTQRALLKLGKDIALARRSRRIAAADFAERAGISRATLYRLEKGDAGASLNTLAMALHVLGRLDHLTNLLDVSSDDVGLMMMRGDVPKRVARAKVSRPPDGESQPDSSDLEEW
jgi:transcriptional regulator with XRE-family HTH domain